MIYYQVTFYNRDKRIFGDNYSEDQLKGLKEIIDPFFQDLNLKVINARMKINYNPDPIKDNLKVHPIEVL